MKKATSVCYSCYCICTIFSYHDRHESYSTKKDWYICIYTHGTRCYEQAGKIQQPKKQASKKSSTMVKVK